MSLEVRCNCGWRCQASEYYLGDRITCAECGAKILVHKQSSVPYGYAPFPTWAKRGPARMPVRRTLNPFAEDPHAASAFWLGLFAALTAMTGCGTIVGILLAVFGIRQALRSNAWNQRMGLPTQGRARAGLILSSCAVLLAGVMFFSLAVEPGGCRSHKPAQHQCVEKQGFRYSESGAAQRELAELQRRRLADPDAWQREAEKRGYRYPAEPKAQRIVPKSEFEQKQIDYSNAVRKQRE